MDFVCRICLKESLVLLPLFEDNVLTDKIEAISSIQIQEDTYLPSEVCEGCVCNINKLYNFRQQIFSSELKLAKKRDEAIKKENTFGTLDFESLKDMELTFELGNHLPVQDTDKPIDEHNSEGVWSWHNPFTLEEPASCGKIKQEINTDRHWKKHKPFKQEIVIRNFNRRGNEDREGYDTNYEEICSRINELKNKELHCVVCKRIFYCQDDLNRHIKEYANNPIVKCSICYKDMKQRELDWHLHSYRHI